VANNGSATVSVISTASYTVVATVAVGSQPRGVAVTPNGTHVYVSNESSDTVLVIATASNTVAATVGSEGTEESDELDVLHALVEIHEANR
jgi:YVTN family beta-propeller protein